MPEGLGDDSAAFIDSARAGRSQAAARVAPAAPESSSACLPGDAAMPASIAAQRRPGVGSMPI